MKTWQAILLGVFFGLLAGAVIWISASKPRGQPISLPPPPTQAPIIIHVTGAVNSPGVYSLPTGSRVEDAVKAAGGFLSSTNVDAVNLAAHVTDGQKIDIPAIIPTTSNGGTPIAGLPNIEQKQSTLGPKIININTASIEELDSLPGIGPSKAASIADYRQKHGPFSKIDEIMDVPGIGPSIFESIKEMIRVVD